MDIVFEMNLTEVQIKANFYLPAFVLPRRFFANVWCPAL